MIQLIPKKTFSQIRYYSEEVLGLVINHQKDTDDKKKRCLDCLNVQPLEEFNKLHHTLTITTQNKNRENNCKTCYRKYH